MTHFREKKSMKRKQRLGRLKVVGSANVRAVKKLIPGWKRKRVKRRLWREHLVQGRDI